MCRIAVSKIQALAELSLTLPSPKIFCLTIPAIQNLPTNCRESAGTYPYPSSWPSGRVLLYRLSIAHPPSTLCHCHLPSGWEGVTWSDGAVGELNNDDGINANDGSDGGQEEFNHYKRPRQWWVPKRTWSRSAMIIPTTDAHFWQLFVLRATTCQGEEGVSNGRAGSKR